MFKYLKGRGRKRPVAALQSTQVGTFIESFGLESHAMKFVKYVEPATNLTVFLACLSFASWQTWKCFEKYLDRPQSTAISIANPAKEMSPTITVCPQSLNASVLARNGIKRYDKFKKT